MIKGYRELNQDETMSINQVKDLADIVGQACSVFENDVNVDKRWLAIAKTDLQKGFMALVRSIAKPEGF